MFLVSARIILIVRKKTSHRTVYFLHIHCPWRAWYECDYAKKKHQNNGFGKRKINKTERGKKKKREAFHFGNDHRIPNRVMI